MKIHGVAYCDICGEECDDIELCTDGTLMCEACAWEQERWQ